MTTSRLAAPGGGAQSGGLQRRGASASKTPGKGRNRAETRGRRKFRGLGSQTEVAAQSSVLAEIRQFAAQLKGGYAEAGTRLSVSETVIRKALAGTYPTTPHRLLEAWAKHRATHLVEPGPYLIRVVRLGRVLVAGRYFQAPGLERLNGRQVLLHPDGDLRYLAFHGCPPQLVGHLVTWAEAQALVPAPETAQAHQGETP
jgi:hypothetical protein